MTDDERKQEDTEEIEDLDASEKDAEQIKGGALQSYLKLEEKSRARSRTRSRAGRRVRRPTEEARDD